jgi:hypothetical protein
MKKSAKVAASLCIAFYFPALQAVPQWTVSEPVEVTATPAGGGFGVSVDPQTGGLGVVFLAVPSGGPREIRIRGFDDQGAPTGGETTLVSAPGIAAMRVERDEAGNLLIAWIENPGANRTLRAGCFSPAGAILGGPWTIENTALPLYLGTVRSNPSVSYLTWTREAEVKVQKIECLAGPQDAPAIVSVDGGARAPTLLALGPNGQVLVGYLDLMEFGDEWEYNTRLYLRSAPASPFNFLGAFLNSTSLGSLIWTNYILLPPFDPEQLARLLDDEIGPWHFLNWRTVAKAGQIGPPFRLPIQDQTGGCDDNQLQAVSLGAEIATVHVCDWTVLTARILSRYGAPYSIKLPIQTLPEFSFIGTPAGLPNGDLAVTWIRPLAPGFGSLYLQFVRRDEGLLFYDGFETGNTIAWMP